MKVHARAGRGFGCLTVALVLGTGLLLGGCADTLTRVRESYQAEQAYKAGLKRYQAKDFAGAIQDFGQALTLDPTFDDAEAHLAWSYYHTGQYVESTRHFRQVLLRQPQWAGLYDGLGWSRYRLQRYNLALEAFQRAVALDPTYRDATIGLGFTLFVLERYSDAVPRLERLTRDGERSGLRRASSDLDQVRSRYAWSLYYLGNYEIAREQFVRGITARPDWAGLHNGLGWSLLRMGNRQAAAEHFQTALKLQPDFVDAKEGLAQVKAEVNKM